VELESQKDALGRRGLGVAALSYDSEAVLRDFAARRGITFPLLSDPDSAVIRRFGLLDPEYPPGDRAHGVPRPVTFVLDPAGVVRSRLAEESYVNRRTAASFLVLAGGEGAGARELRTEFFTVRAASSNPVVVPGEKVTLHVDVDLAPGFHAYAPGAGSYRALELRLEPQPRLSYGETLLPESRPYRFEPLQETVPVFEGRVRVLRDVTFAGGRDWGDALAAGPATLVLEGSLEYQVCSATKCYPPAALPLRWTFEVRPLDRERPPEALRRR